MKERLSRRDIVTTTGKIALVSAGAGLLPCSPLVEPAQATGLEKGFVNRHRSRYFTRLHRGRIRCDLCPYLCEIENGARGRCGVRENVDDELWTVAYGNPCAVQIDPIEKKPFYHVLPGTKTLSLATAGCNLHCKACLNWEAAKATPEETYNHDLPPAEAVTRAEDYGCHSIACSYVEPVVFIEYMNDVARHCHGRRTLHLMHSAGYINRAPLDDICKTLDAACIDLKAFTDDFYQADVEGTLAPVLETLTRLRENSIHTEICNLLIPGRNDDPITVRAMCRWIVARLGAEVPVHFFRFYPRYLLKSIPPTPVPALEQARAVAMEEGLHYAYIANVPEHPGKHTYCPQCKALLVERVGYFTTSVGLAKGKCTKCGHVVPGVWTPRT
jgi:pyruvate formate lyase activating enzyme